MAFSLFIVICALLLCIAYLNVLYKSFERFQKKLNHEESIKDKLLEKRGKIK